MWLGATVYFSFLAANELFGGFPIDTAATAVGLLFPPYFTYVMILSVVGWLLYWLFGRQQNLHNRSFLMGHLALLVGVLVALVNRLFLLPVIHKLTVEMGPVSKANPQLFQQFGMLHGISMLLDLISMIAVFVTWIALILNLRPMSD